MQKWNGTLLRKFDDPTEGNASVGTTVVVRNTSNNSLAVIYDVDDVNSVQKNNPFVTDDFGRYSFYAPSGKYTVEFGDGSDDIEITLVDNIEHNELLNRNAVGAHDAIYARQFGSVDDMVSYTGLVAGERYSTGGTAWEYKGFSGGSITDFTKLNGAHALDFTVSDEAGFDNASILTQTLVNFDLTLPRGKMFESGQVVPSGRFVINGGGSTIKLTSATHPLFFDNALNVNQGTFILSDIKLDLNKGNVTYGNLSGGAVWLGSGNSAGGPLQWDSVIIEDVDCANGFRAALNILSTDRVFVKNYSLINSGIQSSGFFTYGGSTENCRKVELSNIIVRDSYGFGWHLYRCDYVDASNVEFSNLTKDGFAIGFTLTESKRVHIRNHYAQVDGDALEINASQDVVIENFNVIGGNRGLLLGDNGTGLDNQRITLRNGTVNGAGAFSAAINYCHGLLVEDVKFNGPIATLSSEGNRASDLKFRNCTIAQNINTTVTDRRFIHENTRFLNCVYSQHENTFKMIDTGGQTLNLDQYIVIPISPVLTSAAVFYVELTAEFTDVGPAQMGWRRYKCVYSGVNDAGLNNILITLDDSAAGYAAARQLTLEVVGGEMRATNKAAIALLGNYTVTGVRRTASKSRP